MFQKLSNAIESQCSNMWICDECFPDPARHFPSALSFPPCLHYFVFSTVPFLLINIFFLDVAVRKYAETRKNEYNFILKLQVVFTVTTFLLAVGLAVSAGQDVFGNDIYAAFERFAGYGLFSIGILEVLLFFFYQFKKGYSSTGRLWCFWVVTMFALTPTAAYTCNVLIHGHVENDNFTQMEVFNHYLFLALYTNCIVNFVLYSCPSVDFKFYKNFHPEKYASFVSELTLWWANSMLYTGFKHTLELEDIWEVRKQDTTESSSRELVRAWNAELRKHGCEEMQINLHSDQPHSSEVDVDGHKPSTDKEDGKGVPSVEVKSGKCKTATRKPSLFKALAKTYLSMFIVTVVYKVVNDVCVFIAPKIMEKFLQYMAESGPAWYGVCLAFLLLVNSLVQTAFLQRYFYYGMSVGMRQRSALIDLVYRKSLVLSSQGRQESTIGQIVNLMSVDAQKFMDLMTYINLIWSAPFQITIALILLYQQLGFSAFAGLAYMVLTMPLNLVSGNAMKKFQVKQMKEKDNRVKLLTDILNGIKVLKLYAWERAFIGKISDIRRREISLIRRAGYLQAVTSFFWLCSPYMVALFAFTAYILAGNTLYPTTAFVSISLFNILRFPMSVLPMMIAQMVQAKVALDRLTKFLLLGELQSDAITRLPTKGNSIELKNCWFSWEPDGESKRLSSKRGSLSVKFKKSSKKEAGRDEKEDEKLLTSDKNPQPSGTSRFILEDLDFDVPKGSFFAVLGSVGSGKSSLLNAILGELTKRKGSANVDGSVAYVGQQMWIRNATLRDNILFGSEFEPGRYERVIEACALTDDLKILESGDLTEIGEKGINLSGGQKARVSLARAVYSNRDVYLLDDPLAAVDAHVAAHIFEHVIGPKGLLCTKTRMLVTNKLHLLEEVDQIINLQEGRIKEMGRYSELISKDTDDEMSFAQLCKVHLNQQSQDTEEKSVAAVDSHGEDEVEIVSKEEDEETEPEGMLQQLSRVLAASQRSLADVMSAEVTDDMFVDVDAVVEPTPEVEEEANEETQAQKGVGTANDKEAGNKLIVAESVESGNVSLKVYLQYWKSVGYVMSFLSVSGILLVQMFSYLSMMWVARWTDGTHVTMELELSENFTVVDRDKQLQSENFLGLLVYGLIGLAFGVIVVVNAVVFLIGNMRSSTTLHRDMLLGVLKSPLSFFETTPLGRITNRFSKDIDVVDNVLTNIVKTFMQCILVVVTTIAAISFAIPAFLLVLVPLALVYILTLKFYVGTSRQIKRIESKWKSPLYSNFGETLQGLTDIRAYQMNDYFIRKNEELVDILVKTTFANMVINRWLAVRLECIGTFIVFATAFILVFFREGVSSGTAGVAFVYAISCSQVLNWLCRMWAEVETNIVAVERIREYCNLTPEANWDSPKGELRAEWPDHGKIEVKDLEVKYREDLAPALQDVCCTFEPSEKIGIVGRTGSGKSTMTISLFRIVESSKGSIVIDDVDIRKIGLHDLRSRITIIPQDPVIFVGTIRDNLDPFYQYSDAQLWEALELSHLKSFVADLSDQLEFQLGEGGTNISVGQRQLICLARAILRKSKILVLDEATASVDLSTDELIQNTIRSEFKHSTVVTIAHRINTIMDSDRILVLERGKVKEFGSLNELVQNGGYFHSILERENLLQSAAKHISKSNHSK